MLSYGTEMQGGEESNKGKDYPKGKRRKLHFLFCMASV